MSQFAYCRNKTANQNLKNFEIFFAINQRTLIGWNPAWISKRECNETTKTRFLNNNFGK